MFNGDTAYITRLKQQKGAITFAARRHNVNVLLRDPNLPIHFLTFTALRRRLSHVIGEK